MRFLLVNKTNAQKPFKMSFNNGNQPEYYGPQGAVQGENICLAPKWQPSGAAISNISQNFSLGHDAVVEINGIVLPAGFSGRGLVRTFNAGNPFGIMIEKNDCDCIAEYHSFLIKNKVHENGGRITLVVRNMETEEILFDASEDFDSEKTTAGAVEDYFNGEVGYYALDYVFTNINYPYLDAKLFTLEIGNSSVDCLEATLVLTEDGVDTTLAVYKLCPSANL